MPMSTYIHHCACLGHTPLSLSPRLHASFLIQVDLDLLVDEVIDLYTCYSLLVCQKWFAWVALSNFDEFKQCFVEL